MIDWKSKLTSRKFWLAIIGLISGIMLAFKVDAETVETVSGVVMSIASLTAYIIGEGLIDAAAAKGDVVEVAESGQDPEEDDGK